MRTFEDYAQAATQERERRLKWLETRRQGLGGSDIATLLRAHRYKTITDIYHEKLNPPVVVEGNIAMERGNALEPMLLEEYQRRMICDLEETRFVTHTHAKYPYFLATVDGIVHPREEFWQKFPLEGCSGPGVIECKTAIGDGAPRWYDGIPREVYHQTQYYIDVLGLEWGVIVYLVDNVYGHLHIQKDEKLVKVMRDVGSKFWTEHVIPRVPPEPETYEDICKTYADVIEGSMATASDELFKEIRQTVAKQAIIREQKDWIKSEELFVRGVKQDVREAMRNAEYLLYNGEIIASCKAKTDGGRVLRFRNKAIQELIGQEIADKQFRDKEKAYQEYMESLNEG